MARTKFGAAIKWGVLGAAATWFLDPQSGPERRRQVQDKVMGAARKQKDQLSDSFPGGGDPSNGTIDYVAPPSPPVDLVADEVQAEPPGGPTVA